MNDSKLYLQGWPVQADGTFNVNPSDLNNLEAINVKNLGAAVTATNNVGISANLDKSAVVSAGEAGYDGATVDSMADYADDPTTGTRPDFTIELNVVDSTGGPRKLSMAFLKSSANPNEWHAEIYAIPAGDVDNGGGRPGQLAQGVVTFNQDGTIDLANTDLFGALGATPQIPLDASGGAAPKWDDALGLAAQTIDLDLTKITQYASTSTVNAISNDGAGVGNIVAIEVSEEGIVSAIYDNSQIRQIAKVGIATFPNADSLAQVSGNAYRRTDDAGEMTIKEAGVGGAGLISPSSLEASTVDLSSEFTGLIQTQKAYSASSKIITTADQMLEELINIKR